LARTNYSFEKHQKELAKKKRQSKLEKRKGTVEEKDNLLLQED